MSVLDESALSSRHGVPVTHYTEGWLGPRPGMVILEHRIIYCLENQTTITRLWNTWPGRLRYPDSPASSKFFEKLKVSVVCLGTKPRTGRSEIRIPVRANDFPLAHNVQTSSGVKSSPLLNDYRVLFQIRAAGGVMLTTRFHIVSRLSWAVQYRP